MTDWNDFFVATTGAAAALTGLIFVGVSISLTKILTIPTLPTRALLSLTLLLTILTCSLLLLIPQQNLKSLGIEIGSLGLIAWLAIAKMDFSISRKIQQPYKKPQRWNMIIDQLAVIPYVIAAVLFLLDWQPGIYWIVVSVIISFIKAVIDAWVLLVEIHR